MFSHYFLYSNLELDLSDKRPHQPSHANQWICYLSRRQSFILLLTVWSPMTEPMTLIMMVFLSLPHHIRAQTNLHRLPKHLLEGMVQITKHLYHIMSCSGYRLASQLLPCANMYHYYYLNPSLMNVLVKVSVECTNYVLGIFFF